MQQLEGRINNQITGVKGLTVHDNYAAEARDEHVTKLDNLLYIIIALVNIKTNYYLSKTNEFKNIQNAYVSFDIVTLAIYSNNNGNMLVGEKPVFFQFPKRDISTARCKRTICIFIYKGIDVVMIAGFIIMTVLLSMQAVFFFYCLFFFSSKAEFNSF